MPLPELLRKKLKTAEQGDDWQPKTLEQCRDEQKQGKQPTSAGNNKLAKSFQLPKPKNSDDSDRRKPNQSFFKKPLPKPLVDLQNPTEEQIKWDIEDQSFIVKEIVKPPDNPNLRERITDGDDSLRQD